MNLGDRIRRAFERSGLSGYRAAQLADMDRAQLLRFMSRERDLTVDTASRLCEVLGLELRQVRKPAKPELKQSRKGAK